MAGHNKWAQIKHKKGAVDQKRGILFSKLIDAISVAAKSEPNPQFNPRLRSAIEKARENNVPSDKIEGAIKRAVDGAQNLEELIIEAYGPEGAAIIIESVSDNKNRTIAEIKKILSDSDAKFADSGSVLWSFEKSDEGWTPKFKTETSDNANKNIKNLIEKLEGRDDVQKVYTNS